MGGGEGVRVGGGGRNGSGEETSLCHGPLLFCHANVNGGVRSVNCLGVPFAELRPQRVALASFGQSCCSWAVFGVAAQGGIESNGQLCVCVYVCVCVCVCVRVCV